MSSRVREILNQAASVSKLSDYPEYKKFINVIEDILQQRMISKKYDLIHLWNDDDLALYVPGSFPWELELYVPFLDCMYKLEIIRDSENDFIDLWGEEEFSGIQLCINGKVVYNLDIDDIP